MFQNALKLPDMKKMLFPFCFILMWTVASAQNDYKISGKSIVELQKEKPQYPTFLIQKSIFKSTAVKAVDYKAASFSLKQHLLNPYKVEDLAFFCRLEVKIEKKLRIPFKFRVGEVQYTERMEGKY